MSGESSQFERISAELKANPAARNVDIARKLRVKPPYVSTVRQRLGLVWRGRGEQKSITIRVKKDNYDWAEREAKKIGVTVAVFINACLNDARLEAPTPPASERAGA